jgi:hypothetical protein
MVPSFKAFSFNLGSMHRTSKIFTIHRVERFVYLQPQVGTFKLLYIIEYIQYGLDQPSLKLMSLFALKDFILLTSCQSIEGVLSISSIGNPMDQTR